MTTTRPSPHRAPRAPRAPALVLSTAGTLTRAPPQPDANALELFARIVAAGSFAQAARELGLTRAAVSRRVAHIEAQLGVPLFARTTRALGLTEAGRSLAVRARAVLEAADLARHGLRARGAPGADGTPGLAGTLRITSVPVFGQTLLAPLLARFQALHPALRIELKLTQRRIDLLREDIDIALRVTDEPPPDCVAVPVLHFAVRAYAAPLPGVPLADPADLLHNRCLLFSPPTEEVALTWQHDARGERRAVTIRPAMVGDDLGTLQAAARAGGGICLLPDFAAREDLERRRLALALPGWRLVLPDAHVLQALTLPHHVAPHSARELVRYLRTQLAPRGAGAGSV